MRSLILSAGLSMILAQTVTVGWPQGGTAGVDVDTSQVSADFELRVQRYVTLHRALEGAVPTIARSDDYGEVLAAIDALAAQIRAARKGARRGDIFTAPIERWFRQLISKALEGCDVDALVASLNEENPPNVVFVPHVNGRWPEGASLGPMPPRLLSALPRLPDDLEYRLLDRDLILWDSHANVIVDFFTGALPMSAER